MGFLSSLRRDFQGGTDSYQTFAKQRGDWVTQQMAAEGRQPTEVMREGSGDSGGYWMSQEYSPEDQERANQLEAQWLDTLDPATQQKAVAEFSLHSSDMDSINKYGSMATKALIGTIAGGAALSALGGTAAGASSSSAGAGLLEGAEAGLGYGGYGGAGGTVAGQSGLLGGTSIASGSSALGSLGTDIATSAGSLGGAASGSSGLLDTLGSAAKTGAAGMDLKDWASLITGGAGLANSLRDPATAQTPDYMALAQEQARLNQLAADKALAANRPDQYDAAGNSLTWTQDPTTGKWTQTQKLSAGNQALLDNSQKAQLDALRGVAGRGDFNYQGDPLMNPVGNSKDIQDAWMNLLKPEREMALNSEIQRLKNQGLTEDSPAFQRAMLRQNQADTDAQNKALIAGTSEYGNQFARSLQGRQQGFGEYQTDYNAPMQQYQGLMGIAQPQGQFGSFTQAQNPGGAPVYNAGQDQYTANLANANAKNATNNNLTQGLFGLSGAIAKGGWGP